jgi:hypothetical protein
MIIFKVFVPLKLILIFVSYSVQIFIQEKVLILFQVNRFFVPWQQKLICLH